MLSFTVKTPTLTGASIQALNCCSNCAHPAAALPDDAQHPAQLIPSAAGPFDTFYLSEMWVIVVYVPRTEVMIPTQGFAPG